MATCSWGLSRIKSSDLYRRKRKEITDGNVRHFVRSRTMVEIVRTDGLGVIEVTSTSDSTLAYYLA